MSRPQTEAEYLARFPSAPVSGFSRRTLLGGALALGALGLSACGWYAQRVRSPHPQL